MHGRVAADEKAVAHERNEHLARYFEHQDLEHSELQAHGFTSREPEARHGLTRRDVHAACLEPAGVEPETRRKPNRVPGAKVRRAALDAAHVKREFAGALGAADLAVKSRGRKPERVAPSRSAL